MPTLTFASAASAGRAIPLRKRFEKAKDGSYLVHPYPSVTLFSTRNVRVETISDFALAIEEGARRGEALFKGALVKELKHEPRAGVLNNDASTDWVCLDFDKLPAITDIESVLKSIDDLRNVSYVIQYASSHGLDNRFSAHLFMLLEQPVSSRLLESWIAWLNLTEDVLARHIGLNPAKTSIRWPLDPVPARNTQIIYIATPEFVAMKDPMAGSKRIRVVEHRHPQLSVTLTTQSQNVTKLRRQKLQSLRGEEGLVPVKWKDSRGHTIMTGVSASVTDVVDMNDKFVRVNLNNGDSGAYWFWKHDPTYLYSFKDETEVYKLEELDTEFFANYVNSPEYKSLTDRQLVAFMEGGLRGGYRGCEFDPRENVFYMNDALISEPISFSRDRFNEFLKSKGYKPSTFIVPFGNIVFDPTNIGLRFDATTNRVNRFQPSRFMHAKPGGTKVPSNIGRLLTSVLGPPEIVDHFVKWLAVLMLERKHVGTSWLFQGTQGSGKSMLVNQVLVPLVGEHNVSLISSNDLADRFNDYITDKLLIFLDEANLNKAGFMGGMINMRLKSMVGNRRAAVRKMYKAVTAVENYSNLIMATNTQNAVAIPLDDRRNNVGNYQLKGLIAQGVDTNRLVKDITRELDAFASHLMWLAPQVEPASMYEPLLTEARTHIQEQTLPSNEHVARLILNGDLESLFGYISKEVQPGSYEISAQYERVLMRWLWSASPIVFREEVMVIFRFHVPKLIREWVGGISEGRYLASLGFNSHRRKVDSKTQHTYTIDFVRSDELKRAFPLEGGTSHIRRIK